MTTVKPDWSVSDGTFADRFGAIRMMKQFHDATQPPFPYLPVHAEALYKRYVHDHDKLATMLHVNGRVEGIFLACVGQLELAPTMTIATERLWWISEHARALGIGANVWRTILRTYQDWAERAGATIIQVTSYGGLEQHKRVGALYSRMGYSPAEVHYMKVLET